MRLYGKPVQQTWTKLAATASEATLTVDDPVDPDEWTADSTVLVTSKY